MLFKEDEIKKLYSLFEVYFSTAKTPSDITQATRDVLALLEQVERRVYQRAYREISRQILENHD